MFVQPFVAYNYRHVVGDILIVGGGARL